MKNENTYLSLHDALIRFLDVLLKCLHGTSYAMDRPIYLQDIAVVASWIVDLSKKVEEKVIVKQIISHSTNKQFGDYFRQGEFGEKEAEALKQLQNHARQMNNPD